MMLKKKKKKKKKRWKFKTPQNVKWLGIENEMRKKEKNGEVKRRESVDEWWR